MHYNLFYNMYYISFIMIYIYIFFSSTVKSGEVHGGDNYWY